MIRDYHRPKTLPEALELLANPNTRPLGGGTVLNLPSPESFVVVDLQDLGLGEIRLRGRELEIGATARLQELLEYEGTPEALRAALHLEAPLNLRNAATVAGALVACDGRSPFATAMLALDAQLTLAAHGRPEEKQRLGEVLPLREEILSGKLITHVTIPLKASLAFEYVARTPADRPILCAALTQWPSGRTRLVLGGWGDQPSLAMDGPTADGLEVAARNVCHEAEDAWASAEYRAGIAPVLAKRCLAQIAEN